MSLPLKHLVASKCLPGCVFVHVSVFVCAYASVYFYFIFCCTFGVLILFSLI